MRRLGIIVVQKPCLRIPIVLLKWHPERVRKFDQPPVVLPKKHAAHWHGAVTTRFEDASRDAPRAVVCNGQKDERVRDHSSSVGWHAYKREWVNE